MSASAVLVPGTGFSDAGRVAQAGFSELSKTFQQLGQNKQDRLARASEVAAKQTKLAEGQASRDVLMDTAKSAEVDAGVNNQYDLLLAERDKAMDAITRGSMGDRATIEAEYQIANGRKPDMVRQADGSYKQNSDVLEDKQKKADMLRAVETKYDQDLNNLNKKTVGAYESGEFDKVTNAKAYSDRIYKESIAKGLSPVQAEVLRKQEFERTKQAELTKREEYGLKTLDKQEAADTAFDVATNTDKVTTQKASTRGTGGGVVGSTNKALATATYKNTLDGTLDTGPKTFIDGSKNRKARFEDVDLKPFIGSDISSQDLSSIDALVKKAVGEANYNPAMLDNVLDNYVQNRDSNFWDKNVPVGDRTKEKMIEKLVNETITASETNTKARAGALATLAASGGTGNKNVTTTSVQGTTAASKKALSDNKAARTAKYAEKRRAILDKGKNESADQIIDRIYGDKSRNLKSEDFAKKETPKPTPKEKVATKPKTTTTPSKESTNFTGKELKDMNELDRSIIDGESVTTGKTPTDDMGNTKQDRDIFKDNAEATPQQKANIQETAIKAVNDSKSTFASRKKAYDSLDAEGKVLAYNKWKKDNPSGAFGVRDVFINKDSDSARMGAYMDKGIKDTTDAATTIQSERGRAAWKKQNPTLATKMDNTQDKIANIQSKLDADYMSKPNMSKTKATLQKEIERLTVEQETLVKDSNEMQLNSNKQPYKSLDGMVAGSAKTKRAQELSAQRAKANRAKAKHKVPTSYEYEDEGANKQQRVQREAKQAQQVAVMSDVAAMAGGANLIKEGVKAGSKLAITKGQKIAKSLNRAIDSVDSKALSRRLKLFENKKAKNDFSFGAKADVRGFVETAHKKFPKYVDRIKYLKRQGFSPKAAKEFAREL